MTLRLNLTAGVVGALLLISCIGSSAAAQAQQNRLKGRVLDQMRAAIAGARITVVRGGQPAASILSDGNGEFLLPLDPGAYVVTVSSDGFADATRTVTLGRSSDETADFILQVAGFTDAVNVTDGAGARAHMGSLGAAVLLRDGTFDEDDAQKEDRRRLIAEIVATDTTLAKMAGSKDWQSRRVAPFPALAAPRAGPGLVAARSMSASITRWRWKSEKRCWEKNIPIQ
jgi:hypothetical protein